MNPQVLHDYIIYPALEHLGSKYNSKVARILLLSTAAQESHCGTYFKQVKGPALGIYQMEPATTKDLFDNSLTYNPMLTAQLGGLQSHAAKVNPKLLSVLGNTFYATGLARANYYRFSKPLPKPDDIYGIWEYYKRFWNTNEGAATEEEFMKNYQRFVEGVNFDGLH